jgi:hypothetical protein
VIENHYMTAGYQFVTGTWKSLDPNSPKDYTDLMTSTDRPRLATLLDDEVPWPDWVDENYYVEDEYRDYHEEAYNEMLMNGGDV